ncbi:ciliary basal body organization [Pristimantis euphronides]
MEPYEEFYKKRFSRLRGQVTAEAVDPQTVSVVQFHGVAVLSPLLTVEKRQEMQQYRQKAIEVHEKRLNSKKKSLLNRVQEILDTVQVKPISTFKSSAENETTDQTSHLKNMNGFALLPNALNFPVFSSQNGPAKFEKSTEGLISKKEPTPTEKIHTKGCKDCVPVTPHKSPVTHNASTDSSDSSIPETSLCDLPPTKDAPDPYVMSLQNLLKKSHEYIEQSRRSMKGGSKGSSTESHSDKENDTIKISESVKEKTRLGHRSRSCSPLMVDKPTLNKSNTLLQAALSQGQNCGALPTFPKLDVPSRTDTSSGADESDEELQCGYMLEYESNMIKSLTGSYAKLPSPEPSLSPKMHRRRPRPLSAGNIVINLPVNSSDLSPKEKGKTMYLKHPETSEKTALSEFVPKDLDKIIVSSRKRHSFSENLDFVPNSNRYPRSHLINSKMDPDNRVINSRTVADVPHTPISKGVQYTSPSSVNTSEGNALSPHNEPPTITLENVHKPHGPLEVGKRNSPAELNKSYDVETPSPILMQSQSTNQVSDTPNASSMTGQLVENSIQVKCRLDLDVEITKSEHSPVPSEEAKGWLHERRSRSASLSSPKSETLLNSTLEDNLKKKMLAFDEMRKKLEEQHAYQLSLLIAEQEREQERLQREFEEEGRRLRFKDGDLLSVQEGLDSSRMRADWINRNESSPTKSHLDNSHSVSTAGSLVAPSQHSYGSTVESSLGLWGSAEIRAPKISAPRSLNRPKTRWSQVYSPQMQRKFNKVTALAKGFLTRRIMQTKKLKNIKQTVKDTAEFIRAFHTEAHPSRGLVSAQDVSLQERVVAQLRAALYEIHDIFFAMDAAERMSILTHDRELRREKMLRQLEKIKSPRDRVTLSSATQKSLDRKKLTRAVEIGLSNRKLIQKPKALDSRILQPSQGQNAPINKLLCRQGSLCKKNPKKEAKCCDNLRRQHSLG